MRALVTGASGFIGYHVVCHLLEKGLSVSALVRKDSDTSLLRHTGADLIEGDVRDEASVAAALKNCSHIFHLAADYRLWVPDPSAMYAINVDGTRNVMSAALRLGIEKVVYTSSVGALAASRDGLPANEESPVSLNDMTGHYKRSKFLAEQEVYRFIKMGLPAVIVSPSTPVGPMDIKPTPTGKIVVDFLNGRMPAYLDTGLNFVDVRDVAAGHLLAAEKGRIGQKYILGNQNLSLGNFLAMLARITGKRPPAVRLPYYPVLAAAYINELISCIIKRPPLIPVTGVKMASKYMYFDCSKAVQELGLQQRPVEEALREAVIWFRNNGYITKGR